MRRNYAMNETIYDILKITPREIKRWTEENAVDSILPEIIKDLVLASSSRLTRCNFLYGSCNNLPGLDGHVENQQEHPFVPIGESYWEIGCESSANSKANKDYVKRTQETEPELRKQLTFVFVSPQIWKNRQKWETEKKQKKEWHDVRAISAVQLAEWINLYPSQQLNFAQRIKRWYPGATTLATEWEKWTYATKPSFPASFFDLDIARHKKTFIEKITANEASSLTIAADSFSEAYAFIYQMTQTDEFSNIRNRLVVFHTSEAAESMMKKEPKIIPISADADVLAHSFSTSEVPICIHVCSRNHPLLRPDIVLGKLPFYAIVDFAKCYKTRRNDLYTLAQNSGFNRSLYHQRLHFPPLTPTWVKDNSAHDVLLPLAMLGYWDKTDTVQNKLFLELVGSQLTTSDCHDKLAKISIQENSPIWLQKSAFNRDTGAVWVVHSKEEILQITVRSTLREEHIERWFIILRSVLTPNAQRALQNHISQLLETTLMLILHTNQWAPTQSQLISDNATQLLSSALHGILRNKNSILWMHIPLIAEIIPDSFLRILEERLKEENQNFSLSDTQIEYLISSLEMLAIPANYFRNSSQLLCLMMDKLPTDNGTRGRISQTLASIFNVAYPGTNAASAHRKRTFQQLNKSNPNLAWEIAINLVNPYQSTQRFGHNATQRSETWERPHNYLVQDAEEMRNEALKTIFSIPRLSTPQAIKLCQVIPFFSMPDQRRAWEKLIGHWHADSPIERDELYQTIHRAIDRYSKDKRFTVQEATVFLRLLSASIPRLRIRNLFSLTLWQKYSKSGNWKEQLHKLQRVQQKSLIRELHREPKLIPWLLEQNNTDTRALAVAASQILTIENIIAMIDSTLKKTLEKKEREFISRFLLCGEDEEIQERLSQILHALPHSRHVPLLIMLPVLPVIWEFVHKNHPEYTTEYWKNCHPDPIFRYSKAQEKMLYELMNVNRAETALECCCDDVALVPTLLLTRMLGLIALQCNKNDSIIQRHNHIITALINLQQRPNVPIRKLARLEVYFSSDIGIHRAQFKALPKLLLDYPQLAAAFARRFDWNKSIRTKCYQFHMLHTAIEKVNIFSRYPIETNKLRQWCDDFLLHDEIADDALMHTLGSLLASGSAYEMEKWLTPTLIQTIEHYHTIEFQHHFCIAVFNQSNDPHARSLNEGGMREAHCAAELRQLATKLRSKNHLKTAEVVETIAHDMDSTSLFHDVQCGCYT